MDHKLISTEDLAIYWDSHAAPLLIHSHILKRRRRRKRSLRKSHTDSQEGLLSFAMRGGNDWKYKYYASGGIFAGYCDAVTSEALIEKYRVDITRSFSDMLQVVLPSNS